MSLNRFIFQILCHNSCYFQKTQIDTPITNQTSLQKLAYGLKEIRKSQVLENIPVVTSIGKNETFNSWKMDMERAATWLTYFDEFCTLKSEEKVL